MIVRNKNIIQLSFQDWINNFPESFHPLDMERFYVFAKTVHQYSRGKNYISWLRLELSKTKMSLENIDYFCDLLQTLLTFQKVRSFPLYKWTETNEKID